jgi:hypothetical protein
VVRILGFGVWRRSGILHSLCLWLCELGARSVRQAGRGFEAFKIVGG